MKICSDHRHFYDESELLNAILCLGHVAISGQIEQRRIALK